MPPILIDVIQGFSARLRSFRSTIGYLVKTVLAPLGMKFLSASKIRAMGGGASGELHYALSRFLENPEMLINA